MIGIVDLSIGNFRSIEKMLAMLGEESLVSSDASELSEADRLILPGVGSFDRAASRLWSSGIADVLEERVIRQRVPVLGICLGMQLLARQSEEGRLPGLGWIDADVVRLEMPDRSRLPIPHMGWNLVDACRPTPLLSSGDAERFYFVHSFRMECDRADLVVGETTYGRSFASAVQQDNVMGVQFHPEKSHRYGLALLSRFCSRDGVSTASEVDRC